MRKAIISARDRAIEIRSHVRMRTRTRTGSGRGMSREEKSSQASSGVPKPSPDPFYTLRPHAGDVTAVQYLDLGTSGGIASGYATHYRALPYYGIMKHKLMSIDSILVLPRTGSGQLSVWSLSSKRQIWTESCPTGIISVSKLQDTDTLAV